MAGTQACIPSKKQGLSGSNRNIGYDGQVFAQFHRVETSFKQGKQGTLFLEIHFEKMAKLLSQFPHGGGFPYLSDTPSQYRFAGFFLVPCRRL